MDSGLNYHPNIFLHTHINGFRAYDLLLNGQINNYAQCACIRGYDPFLWSIKLNKSVLI